jgi:hypothetical protein
MNSSATQQLRTQKFRLKETILLIHWVGWSIVLCSRFLPYRRWDLEAMTCAWGTCYESTDYWPGFYVKRLSYCQCITPPSSSPSAAESVSIFANVGKPKSRAGATDSPTRRGMWLASVGPGRGSKLTGVTEWAFRTESHQWKLVLQSKRCGEGIRVAAGLVHHLRWSMNRARRPAEDQRRERGKGQEGNWKPSVQRMLMYLSAAGESSYSRQSGG